jgi:tubulin polyglutamylase TTLL5
MALTQEVVSNWHYLNHAYSKIVEAEQKKARAKNDPIKFKSIKDSELLKEQLPVVNYGHFPKTHNDELLYKIVKSDAQLVRSTLEANGFVATEIHDWNILWNNSYARPYVYEGLNEYQRVNHFPVSSEITRKDKMSINIQKMKNKHNEKFDFIPETFVLPEEYNEFIKYFDSLKATTGMDSWIVKPSNLSRGRGIYLINDSADLPLDDNYIVSRYISNPLLVNGLKFDLRIYVVVTSIDPLKIYVLNEGIARFATEKYTADKNLENKFCHLTNYSVNKKNECFVQNKRAEQDNVGNKWSISALMVELECKGIDTNLLWSRIYDIIIKSILSVESKFFNSCQRMQCKSNCFELFGYDILIDEDLKPWLMEINLTPSLAVESPIDMVIKSHLIANMLTLIGLRKYERKRDYKVPAAIPIKGNKKQLSDTLEVFQEAGIAMNANALNMLLVIYISRI